MAWCTSPPKPLMVNTCSFSGTVSNTLSSCVGHLLEVVEVGGLRRLDEVEQDALVFLGRQLLLRGGVHEPTVAAMTPSTMSTRDGPVVERAG